MNSTNPHSLHLHEPLSQNRRRDTLLSTLHEVQHPSQGKTWIDGQDLVQVARAYGIPVAELDGIISFYTLFSRTRRGKHVIRLCDSLSCRICGSLDIYRFLRKKLGISRGMTTGDGMFTLEIVNCLGACNTAPNLMIDETLLSGVSLSDLESLLDRMTKEGV